MRSLGVLATVMLLYAFPAQACRCSPVTSPRAAYQQATAVVRGKIVSLTPVPSRRGSRVKVAVRSAWKQHVPSILAVSTLDLCAYPLKKGQEYVLFLIKDGRDLITTRCMGNQTIEEAGETLQWLQQNGK